MPSRCLCCKTELGKGLPFTPKKIGQRYCLKDEPCIAAWYADTKHGFKPAKTKYLKQEKVKLREKTTKYKNKLQTEVQKIARLIDKSLPCLARGNFGKMAGGHVFSKGGHAQMRFNLHNIHRQCFESNSKQNDDGLMREKLELEYGAEYLNFVKSLRLGDVPKFSNAEYQSIYLKARKVSKWLENENRLYGMIERVKLRNEINQELGVYPEYLTTFYFKK